MADRFVRITLERPYINEGGQEQDIVGLRYGTEPATQRGSYIPDPNGGDAVPVSDRAMMGQERAGAPASFIPGKPIVYTLQWSNEEQRQAIVPDYVAMNYFGDWTVRPGQTHTDMSTPERTHPAEKRRIAMLWHDYKRERRDPNIPNHWRNLKKIAPPAVPHVVIHLLDSAYRTVPNFEYRPWEHFQWEKDCVAVVEQPAPAQGLVLPNGGPIDINALIASLVEEKVKAALAPTKHTGKAA